MVRKILLLALIVFTARVVFPQANQNEINSEFQIAVNLYDANQPQEALKIFQWVVLQPVNPKTTVSMLFSAKILLKQNKFSDAEKTLKKFLEDFSNSKYFTEAELLLAETFTEQGNEKEAAKFLTDGFLKDADKNSRAKKKEFIRTILKTQFTLPEIEELLRQNSDNELTSMFLFYLAKRNIELGKVDEAKKVHEMLHDKFPNSDETIETAKLFQNASSIENRRTSEKIIACLLPLTNRSGRENGAGNDVLEGIKYAVHEYNSLSGNEVALMIKDTKRDSTQVEQLIKELAAKKNYSAIIGPIYSDETKIFLNASDTLDVPIISPTATDNNLQLEHKLFYQANTSMELHGKIMAQYLFYVENKRLIAAIYPTSGNANVVGKNFVAEFESLGGKIIKQVYPPKIHSLEPVVTVLKKNIKGIQGLFLPLNDNLIIPVALSALVKSEIDLPIYGNQDWFTTKGLETSSTLSEKLTFTSDSFIDFQDEDVTAFSQKFLETTGKEINSNNLYGYDAAKFLIKILSKSGSGLQSMEEAITKAEPYEGIHNSIEFGNGKINSYLNIVRYHQGKFKLIERFRYNKRE